MGFNIEHIFYIIGIIFLISTIIYFASEFLFSLTKEIKATILVLIVIATFFYGDNLRERDL